MYFHIHFQLLNLLFTRAHLTTQKMAFDPTAIYQQEIILDIGCYDLNIGKDGNDRKWGDKCRDDL